jgi:4-hydroxy-tetrahydrodipicolinate synthase
VLTLPLLGLGGRGLISVASNQIPGEMTRLVQSALAGDFTTARQLQSRYQELMDINFIESNPIPVKYALATMGLLEPVWRLPMTPPLAASREKIDAVLQRAGLLAGAHV